MNVLLALRAEYRRTCLSDADAARIEKHATIIPTDVPEQIDVAWLRRHVGPADIVISSWDTPAFDAEVMQAAAQLRLVAHAAGSVKPIVSDALWERQVRVSSGAAAISYGVAEWCLGMILLGPKRSFWAGLATRQGGWHESLKVHHGPHELYQQAVGIVGAGFVGRKLLELLAPFDCERLVFDPYLQDQQAAAMGATRLESLEELFERSATVVNCAPLTDQTRGMIGAAHLGRLRQGGCLISPARGGIIDERALIAELARGRIVACLDTTESEPPAPDHPLRKLDNVWLTPHQAGVTAENRLRIGTLVTDEVIAFIQGEPLRYEVKADQLASIG